MSAPSRRSRSRGRAQREPDSLEPRTARIIRRVREIPEGFVRTYGDIDPGAPRLVGRVLATHWAGEGHSAIPWHRVVRADGSTAIGEEQLELLRQEGVPIRGDRVDLREVRLPPEAA